MDHLNGLNQYDFSARWLDNAVPGFTSSDPLAERHPDESPYLYCGNNPVNRVDSTGMDYFSGNGATIYIPNNHDGTYEDPETGETYTNSGDTYSEQSSDGTYNDKDGELPVRSDMSFLK